MILFDPLVFVVVVVIIIIITLSSGFESQASVRPQTHDLLGGVGVCLLKY